MPWNIDQECRDAEDVRRERNDRVFNGGRMNSSQWISVEDRLPKRGKYLVYNGRRCTAFLKYPDEKTWYVSEVTYAMVVNVTHWQPLPAPPLR